ncbi:DJ-1/PfpI family protein [Neisseria sp. ZJ106]|uniref:DJ-1/PfpI family protein n=1 Tax=Neisseria lisongii TaxID=2912188 RepID=A0ABY7RLY0_9NEIS|nr:DJ-1/PfpI family protein [Neisseria lisongii]MCF7520926.1 DJ-1/PfpI family protein [Neisseria lisongii]WCL71270.1 DJ-1/PfpI family protein [Neisseria lisongii]
MHIYCLLFDDYETLDLMGPVEFLFRIPHAQLHYVSHTGGAISSRQGFSVATQRLNTLPPDSVLLVPGGQGTRALVGNPDFIRALSDWAQQAKYCLCVCTGSALLAKTGLLDGLAATSNKKALSWVAGVNHQVCWQTSARWTVSGKFYTSSGVSAGMDMALAFIADCFGNNLAESIADHAEYIRNRCASHDPFAATAILPEHAV